MSDPIKRDPILDQFSVISRSDTRLINGLKTIPFPATHIRIANTWEYPPREGGGRGVECCEVIQGIRNNTEISVEIIAD